MSGFLKGVGQVAGIVASVAAFIPGAQPIAAAAAAVSAVASVGAQLTARKPAAQGSTTSITIGANMPSPYIIGESYYGGNRVHLVGYGTDNDVPNAYLAAVDIYGVGGPYNALVGTYADFTEITFSSGNATGFYHDHLYIDTQLGETPEATALTPHYSGMPDWGSGYKLSGKPAILYNARFPKSGKKFGSGFPQTGAIWQGTFNYDPRLDDDYDGGAGAQRWADPTDKAAFSAAKATWAYNRCPGLNGLRYALGVWERDETDTDAEYQKVFGIGIPWDGIIVADFVELANVCDANGWTCNGVIFEPGDKWANLKSILQAGGAEPCFRGGKLGLRINAPRVSLDTITVDDLADGEVVAPGMQGYRDRLNTIIPKYRSPDHKWEYVTSVPVTLEAYVTEDGEEKASEVQFNLVTNADQAAQLAGYALVGGREKGPIELVCKPRLRKYGPGDLLTLDIPEAYPEPFDCIVLNRTIDPATMTVSLTLVSEDPDKHDFALALTGTAPPAITIQDPTDIDDIASGADPTVTDAALVTTTDSSATISWVFPFESGWEHVVVLRNTVNNVATASDASGPITGVAGAAGTFTDTGLSANFYYWWVAPVDSDGTIMAAAGPVSGTVWDAAAYALFARMTSAPDLARKTLINSLITSLKAGGVWSKCDGIWLLAAHDAQAGRLNWKGATNDLTAVGSLPTFTTDRGYQGNGSSQLLTTGFIPGTGQTLQNSHHLSVWPLSAVLSSIADLGSDSLSIAARGTSDFFVSRSATSTGDQFSTTTGDGFYLISRSASTGYTQYRNGTSFATITRTSAAFGGVYPLYICGRNNSGTPNYNAKQIAAASIGGTLNSTEQAAFYSAVYTYLHALGAV